MIQFIFALLVGGAFAQNGDLVERNFTGTSTQQNPLDARREIQEQAALKTTEDLAKELLGEEKSIKARPLLQGKVAKASARYLPFSKPGTLESTPNGFQMSVALKVDLRSFRQVLQENGLLNENEAAPLVLPLVSFVDKVHLKSERWWMPIEGEVQGPLRTWSRQFENLLRQTFLHSGFYLIPAMGSKLAPSFPSVLRSERPSPEDLAQLGDWFGAPLVIEGTVQILKGDVSNVFKLEFRLSVVQSSNNRPLADVSRSYTTEAGSFDAVVDKKLREIAEPAVTDLVSQVFEAWQKGSVGSAQLRLSLNRRLTLPEMEIFKEKIRNGAWSVRNIHERLLTGEGTQFEIESPLLAQELVQKMNGLEAAGRRWNAVRGSDTEIKLEAAQ